MAWKCWCREPFTKELNAGGIKSCDYVNFFDKYIKTKEFGEKPICECVDNSEKENDSKVKTYNFPDPYLVLSNDPKRDTAEFNRTIIVRYSNFSFQSLDDLRKSNSQAVAETKFIYKYGPPYVEKSVFKFSYCGDGKIQKNEGEICDDGINNGKPGKCDCECKKITKSDNIEECK